MKLGEAMYKAQQAQPEPARSRCRYGGIRRGARAMKKSSTRNSPRSTTRTRADHAMPAEQAGASSARTGAWMVDQDYYDLLGSAGRTAETIKAAYRKLAKECHPDRHNGCSQRPRRSSRRSTKPTTCLKDPQKRAAYDRFGKAAFQNGGGGDPVRRRSGFNGFSDIFSTIFGEFMDPRGAGRTRRAAPTCATTSN